MRYLTAIEAARRIGVTEKTVRIWIQHGKLEAYHPAPNRLAIAEADVERLARERQLYYGTKPETSPFHHMLPEASAHDVDRRLEALDQKVSDLTQSITNLNTTISSQTRRIDELTKRVVDLEARSYPVVAEKAPVPFVSTSSIDETSPKSKPRNRIVEPEKSISPNLSSETITASEFAAQIGLKYDDLRNFMRRGVNGERLDVTEVPHPTRAGYTQKYFSPPQMQKAIEILKRHGKIE